MNRLAIAALALVLALAPAATAQDTDAKRVAQGFLDKGAILFDARDAAGLAATYTADAKLDWIGKDNDTNEIKVDTKSGRAEIEGLYRDLFKDSQDKEKTTSKNHVEFARLVAPDLIVVQGAFQPNTADDARYPFVQVRRKMGDRWMILSLQLFVVPKG